jgi:hypothetical protein
VLEGFWLGRGVLWSALARAGRSASSREEDDWEGALGANLVLPPLFLAWVGAGDAGGDRGTVQEHGYSAGASKHSDHHSELRLGLIFSASVRRNARKRFKFEFLKISCLSDQHIGQGVLSYFCYQERRSFAEILFQILV